MIIHLGQSKTINLNDCELVLNLQTIDEATKTRILKNLPPLKGKAEYKAAIKTTNNEWLGSTISSEALAQRGEADLFTQAFYSRR